MSSVPTRPEMPQDEATHKGARILVVDDDVPVATLLARQLERMDYAPSVAHDGRSALELMGEEPFEVALIDLVMPDMDGISVLRAMAESDFDTVGIVVSGAGTIGGAVEAMKIGAFDFVEKGSGLNDLRGTIERAIRHRELKSHDRYMTRAAQEWETTFNAVSDLIAIIDGEHRLVRANKAMADRLKCAPDEAVGCTCYESLNGMSAPPAECPHVLSMRDGQEHTATIYDERMDGYFLVSTSPLLDGAGRPLGTVHVMRDVTAQKRIEQELRLAHAETEKLLASMSSFLIAVDGNLKVTRWNAAAEIAFAVKAEQAIGKDLKECGIKWNWDTIRNQLDAWLRGGEPIRLGATKYARPDGSEGFLGITVNPVRNGDATLSGFFLLGADITERLSLETQLVHAQKLESIGRLAAGIAHEINTPIQYVGDNTRFLEDSFGDLLRLHAKQAEVAQAAEEGAPDPSLIEACKALADEIDVAYLNEEIPKAISQSLEGVERVAKIVRAMKDFSHPGTGEKAPCDLNKAIESTITVARNEWKYVAEVVTEFDSSLPLVACLPAEFNQVILNIIVNAAHAIADVVEEDSQDKGAITIRTRQEGDWAVVSISDTGTGIPKEAQGAIFDPFFTTKEVGKGTGQGLAIARNVIVDKHGGTLTFESEQGKGTTFVIRMPIEV